MLRQEQLADAIGVCRKKCQIEVEVGHNTTLDIAYKRIVAGITDLFSGTDYENFIFQIVDMFILLDRPKVLYLNSFKSFCRKAGSEVYRKIKNCAINI